MHTLTEKKRVEAANTQKLAYYASCLLGALLLLI